MGGRRNTSRHRTFIGRFVKSNNEDNEDSQPILTAKESHSYGSIDDETSRNSEHMTSQDELMSSGGSDIGGAACEQCMQHREPGFSQGPCIHSIEVEQQQQGKHKKHRKGKKKLLKRVIINALLLSVILVA